MHTPLHTPLETQKTPFQSLYYRVTVDAIKASTGSSDPETDHRDTIMLHNKVGYVHHGIYTMA
jgi:hypothetical protein